VPFLLQIVGIVVLVGYLSYLYGQQIPEQLAGQLLEHRSAQMRIGLLGALILLATTGTSILTTRWIAKPILKLSQASQALAQGNWQQPVSETTPIAELRALTHFLNQTAVQLQRSGDRSPTPQVKSDEKSTSVFRTNPEDILNSALAAITSMRVFADGSWQIDQVSAGCEIVSGYTAEALKLDNNLWIQQIEPTDWQTIAPQVLSDIFAERTDTYEYRFHHKNGSLRWIAQTNNSGWDEAQQCWVVTAISVDITDRKRAEIALQQSENRFLELSKASPANIYILVRRVDGSVYFEYMSQAIEVIHEIPVAEILADASLLFKRIHPDDRSGYEAAVQRSLETLQPFHYEWRIITLSGAIKWLQGNSCPKQREHGEVAWYGVVTDITDRKAAEIALQQSELRFRRITDANIVGIILTTPTGEISEANDAFLQMVGYDRTDLLAGNLRWDSITPPEYSELDTVAVTHLLAHGWVQPFEKQYIRKDGSRVTVMVGGALIEEHTNQVISVILDISDRKQAEAALAQEILRRRTLFNISIDGIAILDQVGNVVEANTSFANMLGYSLEEVLTLNLIDFDAYWTEAEIEQKIHQADLCNNIFETRHRRKDGSVFDVEISSNSVDWDGQTLQFCICRDISDRKRSEIERKQAEIALRESEERLRIALEAAQMGNWDWNISTNQIIWSESLERLMGLEPGMFDGRFETVAAMIYPDDRQRVANAITYSVEHDNDYNIEFRFVKPDGSLRWALSKGKVWRDQTGQAIRMAGVDVDITDRKHAEDALRDSEERFRAVFEQAAVGLEYTDLTGQLLLVNRALVNLLGYSEEELLALNFQDITHPEDLAENQQYFQQLLAGEMSSYSLEKRFIHKDGSHIWVNITVSLICGPDGQPKLTLAVIEDIRDRKQAALELQQAKEAAEAANVAKSMFLANMSHELRTPLNVILGYAQLLSYDTSLTPEYLDYLRSIHRSGNHLLALINDVLDLSKIEAGRSTFDPSSFDLHDLMHTLWEMFRFRAESKGLELTLELAEAPRLITTDLNKLRQVMINLLNNAVKFTVSGTIALRVWVDQESIASTSQQQAETIPALPPSHRLRIAVEDSGIGISPDELETIFEAFSQASAGKHSTEGTGLGLTISQKFIQLMNGQLWAESQIGQGSKFSVAIPIQLANLNEQVLTIVDRPVIGLLPGQPPCRILVVDDQLANRQLLTQILQKVGLDIREAASGTAAIQQWQTWKPHLIWMDLRMAGMTGYEAMQQIRLLEQGHSEADRNDGEEQARPSSPSQPPIPIIALTAQAYQHDREFALKAGFTDFVTKPFRTAEIFQQLTTYLGLQYLYADAATSMMVEPFEAVDKHQVLRPEALQVMPATWILALHKAALNCSSEEVEDLIAQIPADYAALAKGLQRLAHNYDFEIIMQLSQSS
jgi:PAS domain S-box-containing protein